MVFSRPNRLIIPQYSAPAGLSLVAAAELLGDGKRAVAAQLIDFAVRRVVTVSRGGGKRRASKSFTFRLADASREGEDERAILAVLFGRDLEPGEEFTLSPGRNRELGQRLREPHREAVARLIASGRAREKSLVLKLLTPWRKQPVVPTAQGEPIVDHLWGIHDYIELAEKERFAMLQSPDGALRRTVAVPGAAATLGPVEVLVLNEKLLPYAVLFGLEKQWARQLDVQYREIPTDLLDATDAVLAVTELTGEALQIAEGLIDLTDLVDAADALDGIGAFFGGLGDVLSGIDFS